MKCRLCLKATGVLIRTAPSSDYIPARRGHRPVGMGPSYVHADCHADQAVFEAASLARYRADMERLAIELGKSIS